MDKQDLAGGAAWIVLSVFAFSDSLRLGIGALRTPGPGFIPFWASLFLAIFACILMGSNLLSKPALRPKNGARVPNPRNALIVIAALAFYCLALEKIGYLLGTCGLMLVLFGLGKMNSWVTVFASVVTALSSYGLFAHVLGTPLPKGILGF